MSYAIHIFMPDKFSEEPYRRFLCSVQNLFGKWNLAESTPVYGTGLGIHECRIKSEDLPSDEGVSVWVSASRRVKDVPVWHFDYEWYLSFETGTGRSAMGLAVQLGALLLATQTFRWILVVDRDAYINETEPTEFRTKEALVEHLRRVLRWHVEFREYLQPVIEWFQEQGVWPQVSPREQAFLHAPDSIEHE